LFLHHHDVYSPELFFRYRIEKETASQREMDAVFLVDCLKSGYIPRVVYQGNTCADSRVVSFSALFLVLC
jgi:hypothetical protein